MSLLVSAAAPVRAATQLSFEQSTSPEIGDLMWSAFFRERGRGRSIGEHFPWLADPRSADAWLATIRNDRSQPVAALVLKRHFERTDTASIGLVCVRADLRGQGLSQGLVSGAIREAEAFGMTNLTLWTGKPSVYLKHGFETRDPALFGWVRVAAGSPTSKAASNARRIPWPDAAERHARNRGLPPFAVEAYRLIDESDRAQAIVVDDAGGPIVAEWSGNDVHVAQLLRAALPAAWRLNALHGDPLIAALQGCGVDAELSESRLQMWRTHADASQAELPRFRLLDRI